MKIDAKDILAEELHKVRTRPLLEEISAEDIEKIIEDDLSHSDQTRLEVVFNAHEHPDRLRIMDSEGEMFDVMVLPNGRIGIEKLEPRIHYLGVKPYGSWAEAQEALPDDWESSRAVNAHERNPYRCRGTNPLGIGLKETQNS